MHQKWNIRHDHATRFFDGITSFSSMLHSFLTAFRKTIYQTIYQTITNKIKNPFLRQKEKKQCGNVSQKICNPLVKAKK